MIVCTECGHRNDDDDDFCGSCGAFLEFSGERSAPEEVEVEVEEELDEEHRPTMVERVKAAVGLGEAEGAAGAAASATVTGSPPDEAVAGGVATDGAGLEATEEEIAAAEAAAEVRRRSEEEAARRAAEAEEAAEAARQAAAEAERVAAEEAERAAEAEARRVAEQEAREAADRQAAEAAVAAAQAEAERAAAEERAAGEAAEAESSAQAEAERAAQEAAEEEARQRAEAEAREAAERAAQEEAEAAKRLAEEQAKAAEAARLAAEEREREAEQAARMAALVAKAKPTPLAAPPEASPPKADEEAPADSVDGDAAAATAARKPAAVKPQKQRVKRAKPTTTAADEVLNPGDLVCGSCGVGNDPDRKFCRRCGNSLVAAAVVPKLPWYKRIFRRKPKAKAEAGTRPDQKTGRRSAESRLKYTWLRLRTWVRKSGKLLAILGIGGVAALSLGPWRGAVSDQFGKVKRLVSPEYESVRAASATSSSEASGHPASAAIDQVKNSYWAEGAGGTGEGQVLTVTFAEPVDLDRVGFLNGASEQPEDFTTQPRIREAQLSFDNGTTETLELDDEADFQEKGISADDVTTVQLQIISVYPSPQGGDAASLAEIEFFTEK